MKVPITAKRRALPLLQKPQPFQFLRDPLHFPNLHLKCHRRFRFPQGREGIPDFPCHAAEKGLERGLSACCCCFHLDLNCGAPPRLMMGIPFGRVGQGDKGARQTKSLADFFGVRTCLLDQRALGSCIINRGGPQLKPNENHARKIPKALKQRHRDSVPRKPKGKRPINKRY